MTPLPSDREPRLDDADLEERDDEPFLPAEALAPVRDPVDFDDLPPLDPAFDPPEDADLEAPDDLGELGDLPPVLFFADEDLLEDDDLLVDPPVEDLPDDDPDLEDDDPDFEADDFDDPDLELDDFDDADLELDEPDLEPEDFEDPVLAPEAFLVVGILFFLRFVNFF
jgi:hypothetical protein